MTVGRGYIFYNQQIPDDEIWEDTLNRENLIIVQIGKEAESITNKGKFNVTIFTKPFNLLVSKYDILTVKEIEKLLA